MIWYYRDIIVILCLASGKLTTQHNINFKSFLFIIPLLLITIYACFIIVLLITFIKPFSNQALPSLLTTHWYPMFKDPTKQYRPSIRKGATAKLLTTFDSKFRIMVFTGDDGYLGKGAQGKCYLGILKND